MRDFGKRPLGDFLQTLGSASAEPGGGAAAGLVAATGMALLEMTARINDKRAEKSGKLPATAAKRIAEIAKYRERLVELMALDAEAFGEISKRYKDPKDSAPFQAALKNGASVPMEIAEMALKGLSLGVAERPKTGRWLASDLAEAGTFLESSLRAARLNVEINLKDLLDRPLAAKTRARLDAIEKKASVDLAEIRKVLK